MNLFEFNNKVNLVEATSNKWMTKFINQVSSDKHTAYLTKYVGNYNESADVYEFFMSLYTKHQQKKYDLICIWINGYTNGIIEQFRLYLDKLDTTVIIASTYAVLDGMKIHPNMFEHEYAKIYTLNTIGNQPTLIVDGIEHPINLIDNQISIGKNNPNDSELSRNKQLLNSINDIKKEIDRLQTNLYMEQLELALNNADTLGIVIDEVNKHTNVSSVKVIKHSGNIKFTMHNSKHMYYYIHVNWNLPRIDNCPANDMILPIVVEMSFMLDQIGLTNVRLRLTDTPHVIEVDVKIK